MENKKAIDIIYDNLKAGMIYAEFMDYVTHPMYWSVLHYDHFYKLFRWRHYGSSANKATKKDLRWILKVIFKLTPEEFINKYHCVTLEEYNKF